jgi:xanthine dehydrogenase/oxidase
VVGFISFVNHIDVPGSNKMADILEDEEVFVSSIAPCIGAVVGVVVCESEEAARIASKLIHIEYELLLCFQQGDVDKSLADAENIIEGTVLIGGQEHFYLETNCCIVIPSDDDKELQLHLGTQNLTAAQELIALVLGRDASRISCHVKRMGGAFGGKETRP